MTYDFVVRALQVNSPSTSRPSSLINPYSSFNSIPQIHFCNFDTNPSVHPRCPSSPVPSVQRSAALWSLPSPFPQLNTPPPEFPVASPSTAPGGKNSPTNGKTKPKSTKLENFLMDLIPLTSRGSIYTVHSLLPPVRVVKMSTSKHPPHARSP